MTNRLASIGLVWILAGLQGCQSALTPKTSVHPLYGEQYELSNGSIRLVVAPSVGRAVELGRADRPGENVFWLHPDPVAFAPAIGNWRNYGGDKIWSWPQTDWGWPPPVALDAGPYTVQRVDRRSIVMIGPIDLKSGLRAEREYWVPVSGNYVEATYRLVRVRNPFRDAQSRPVAVWSVMQIPAPTRLSAQLIQTGSGVSPTTNLAATTAPSLGTTSSAWVDIEPNYAAGKLGIAASAFRASIGDTILTVSRISPCPSPDDENISLLAQIYADSLSSPYVPVGTLPYIELEFLTPLQPTRVSGVIEMRLRFDLMNHNPAETEGAKISKATRPANR